MPPLPVADLGDGVVRLRPWTAADAPMLVAAWADAEVRRHAAVPEPADLDRARRWIAGWDDRRQAGLVLDLVIVGADEPAAVAGEVGLGPIDWLRRTGEVGYWLGPGARGRGLARRAVPLLADWALAELALATLVARVPPDHTSSAAVVAAAGFTRRGRLADGRDLWARSSGPGGGRGTFEV